MLKDEELIEMEDELRELQEKIERKRYDLIFDETGLQSSEVTIDDFWGCEKSPIGWCVYDKVEDPAHDSCVFCGEPEKRK